nr:ORF6N domain-containing protein [Lachnospira multipara]
METIDIRSQIHIVRGKQVMLDSDLAMLYKVETGALNRAVKRNKKRFPEDFCFQLSEEEFLRCQNGISKDNDPDGRGGRRYMPYAFTEQKIFFDGQIYDAFSLITTIIQKAKSDIVLIDGYVDVNMLNILVKKDAGKKCFVTVLLQKN